MMDSIEYRIHNLYAGELLSDWTIGDKLGGNTRSGSESLVVEIKRKGGTETGALKVAQIYKEHIQGKAYKREEDEEAKNRCMVEVEAMKKLKSSPYIMDCEGAVIREWEGDGYYGCDLLIRMPYKECLRQNPYEPLAVSCETAVQIGKDICRALVQCHAANIIHRDIKPGNIFVETRDGVKRYLLGDFGIAKVIRRGNAVSNSGRYTLEYAAPEQYHASEYTKQADIYCLGLTLYELCNGGYLPFMHDSSSDAAIRRLRGQAFPPPRAARKNLSAVIMKACAYDAQNRYQSAEEFLDALEALEPEDLQARPVGEQETRGTDPYGTLPAQEGYGKQNQPPLRDPPTDETPSPGETELPPLKKALAWMKARKKQIALAGGVAAALIVAIAVRNWLCSVGGPPDISDEPVRMVLDETYQVALQPEGKSVVWSSENEAIASVDENGLITAHGTGSTEIRASDPLGREDTCQVQVFPRAETLTLTPSEPPTMDTGDTLPLSVEISPQDALTDNLLWRSSRPEIVSVTQDGLLTAHGYGTATITVSDGNLRAESNVQVWPVVTGITLSAPGLTFEQGTPALALEQGKSETLQAILSPQGANGRDVTWSSSDESVALVEPSGKVTGVQPGTAEITASCGEASAKCRVTVEVPVTGVAVRPTTLGLKPGESGKLTAEVAPKNATSQTVEWSSSRPSVARVDASGNVTAVSRGTATIEASCGGKHAACTVTVVPDTPEPSTTTTTNTKNNAQSVSTPATNTEKNSQPVSTPATNTEKNSQPVSAPTTPESSVIKATGITLKPSELTLDAGDSETITATVSPSNASDKTVKWSSSDESVARVSQSGQITARAPGKATITASCGDVSDHCTVTVTPIEVTSVEILDEAGTHASDILVFIEETAETLSLSAVVTPENATDKTVRWSSDNPDAVRVDNGLVTVVGEGSATVTATCGGQSDSVLITGTYLLVVTDDDETEPSPPSPSPDAPKEIPWEDEEPVPADPGEIWIH